MAASKAPASEEGVEDGNAAIDKIAQEPDLDFFFFDRNPNELTDEDLLRKIEIERTRRAQFIEKKGN